jgi:hypothetical protein
MAVMISGGASARDALLSEHNRSWHQRNQFAIPGNQLTSSTTTVPVTFPHIRRRPGIIRHV